MISDNEAQELRSEIALLKEISNGLQAQIITHRRLFRTLFGQLLLDVNHASDPNDPDLKKILNEKSSVLEQLIHELEELESEDL